jgi:hypothetical protein
LLFFLSFPGDLLLTPTRPPTWRNLATFAPFASKPLLFFL